MVLRGEGGKGRPRGVNASRGYLPPCQPNGADCPSLNTEPRVAFRRFLPDLRCTGRGEGGGRGGVGNGVRDAVLLQTMFWKSCAYCSC